ncbi:hypothetical protein Ddye_025454 [Dipteronia dyeriana]|uniref:Uncharacterized protein n=1 Tax=Dipteronia dyeriana TaxID=168575 RepID=A0AAD9TK84_9ROSI|nr:hypothetical protein Ddye_025454 [Dipteronia dyeriana]
MTTWESRRVIEGDWRSVVGDLSPSESDRRRVIDRRWQVRDDDRYRSHAVNGKSCHYAYKSVNALEVIFQVISIVSVGIVAATRHSVIMPTTGRITVVSMAAVCFLQLQDG